MQPELIEPYLEKICVDLLNLIDHLGDMEAMVAVVLGFATVIQRNPAACGNALPLIVDKLRHFVSVPPVGDVSSAALARLQETFHDGAYQSLWTCN